jgi:hypothetical protein
MKMGHGGLRFGTVPPSRLFLPKLRMIIYVMSRVFQLEAWMLATAIARRKRLSRDARDIVRQDVRVVVSDGIDAGCRHHLTWAKFILVGHRNHPSMASDELNARAESATQILRSQPPSAGG